ncbi:MAG: hypothetical protein V4733_09935 [Verrucomicrobiota bacterium]
MKLCIIGNSHVGALKRAWNQMEGSYSGTKIDFFAHRGDGMADLVVDGARLVANNRVLRDAMHFTSGGKDFIEPAAYDCILVYALGLKSYHGLSAQGVSARVKELAAGDGVRSSVSFGVMEKIRRISDKKIHLGHAPLPAAEEVTTRNKPSGYFAGVRFLNEKIFGALNSELVAQPRATIVNSRNTDPEFTKSSKRLEIGDKLDGKLHPEYDASHMNDEFGRIWLSGFFKMI